MRNSLVAWLAIASLAFAARAEARAKPPAREEESARLARLTARVAASYDSVRGGFVSKDGVPDAAAVELAFRMGKDGLPLWNDRGLRTVQWTWSLFDTVGGGYLESTRDTRTTGGTFEKRTDSNSRRLENRIDAWQVSHAEWDRRAGRRVLDFFERTLEDGRGAFVAGQVGARDLLPVANGYAIHAYLCWAAATGEPMWRDRALRAVDRIWTECWSPELGLMRKDVFGEVTSPPRLDDQIEYGRALVLATYLGGRENDLVRARQVADLVLTRFEDTHDGGMREVAAPAKNGSIKKAKRESWGNARAARFFAEMASVSGDGRYREAARRVCDAFAGDDRSAADDAEWALALRAVGRPDFPARPEWKAAPAPAPRSQPFNPPTRSRSRKGRG